MPMSSSTNLPEDAGAIGAGKPGKYYSYGVPYLPLDQLMRRPPPPQTGGTR